MPGVTPAPIRNAVRAAVAATGIAADVSAYDYKPLLDMRLGATRGGNIIAMNGI